jgi:hypothetical protein
MDDFLFKFNEALCNVTMADFLFNH